jgi:hypothetical protein
MDPYYFGWSLASSITFPLERLSVLTRLALRVREFGLRPSSLILLPANPVMTAAITGERSFVTNFYGDLKKLIKLFQRATSFTKDPSLA